MLVFAEKGRISQEKLRAQLSVNLRALRLNAGLKQETVAKFLQISRSTYSYYEIGTTTPDVSTLYVLCQFYNIPTEALFTPGTVPSLFPDVKRVRECLKDASLEND